MQGRRFSAKGHEHASPETAPRVSHGAAVLAAKAAEAAKLRRGGSASEVRTPRSAPRPPALPRWVQQPPAPGLPASCLRRAARRRRGRANAHRFGGTPAASTVCLQSTARGQRNNHGGRRCVNGVHPCTPRHMWQAPNRSSQTEHSGVRWPGCQRSLGTRSLARHGERLVPNSSPSQNRPVMRPQSTQARQRSDSSPALRTVRADGFAL